MATALVQCNLNYRTMAACSWALLTEATTLDCRRQRCLAVNLAIIRSETKVEI